MPALWWLARLELIRWRIRRDPNSKNYTDVAIAPAALDDKSLFELYRKDNERLSGSIARKPSPEAATV